MDALLKMVMIVLCVLPQLLFAQTVGSDMVKKWESAPAVETLYAPIPETNDYMLLPEQYREGAEIILSGSDKKAKKYFERLYKSSTSPKPGAEPNDLHAYAAYELAHFEIYKAFDPWYNGVPSLYKMGPILNKHELSDKERCDVSKLINRHCNYKTRALMLYQLGGSFTYTERKTEFGSRASMSDLVPAVWAVLSDDRHFIDTYLPNFFFKHDWNRYSNHGLWSAWQVITQFDFWESFEDGYYPWSNTLASITQKMWKSLELLPYLSVDYNASVESYLIGKSEFELSNDIYKRIKEEGRINVFVFSPSLLSVYYGNNSNFPIFLESARCYFVYELEKLSGKNKGADLISMEEFILSEYLYYLRELPEFEKYGNEIDLVKEEWKAEKKAELNRYAQRKAEKDARRARIWGAVAQGLAQCITQTFAPAAYSNIALSTPVPPLAFPQMEFIYNPSAQMPVSAMSTMQGNIFQQLAAQSINQVEAQNYANYLQFQESAQRMGQSVSYDDFMAIQGAALQNNNPANTTSAASAPQTTLTQHDCPWCRGTGKVLHETSVPTFGLDKPKKYCDICNTDYTADHTHTHLTCSHCGSTGKMR